MSVYLTCKPCRWCKTWCLSGTRGSFSGSPPGSSAAQRPELLAGAETQPTGCCVSAALPAPALDRTRSSSGRFARSHSWRTATVSGLRCRYWCCCSDIFHRCLWQGALLRCCPAWGSAGSESEQVRCYKQNEPAFIICSWLPAWQEEHFSVVWWDESFVHRGCSLTQWCTQQKQTLSIS